MINEEENFIEEDRKQALKEESHNQGKGWENKFFPGTFGYHELLDRSSIIVDLWEETILNHPATILNAALYKKAIEIEDMLIEFYQVVGQVEDIIGD